MDGFTTVRKTSAIHTLDILLYGLYSSHRCDPHENPPQRL
jgi:hypothetical protein